MYALYHDISRGGKTLIHVWVCGCIETWFLPAAIVPNRGMSWLHHFSSCQFWDQHGKWWREVGVANFRGGVELAWQTCFWAYKVIQKGGVTNGVELAWQIWGRKTITQIVHAKLLPNFTPNFNAQTKFVLPPLRFATTWRDKIVLPWRDNFVLPPPGPADLAFLSPCIPCSHLPCMATHSIRPLSSTVVCLMVLGGCRIYLHENVLQQISG